VSRAELGAGDIEIGLRPIVLLAGDQTIFARASGGEVNEGSSRLRMLNCSPSIGLCATALLIQNKYSEWNRTAAKPRFVTTYSG